MGKDFGAICCELWCSLKLPQSQQIAPNPSLLPKCSRTFGAICWECWELWCSLKLPRSQHIPPILLGFIKVQGLWGDLLGVRVFLEITEIPTYPSHPPWLHKSSRTLGDLLGVRVFLEITEIPTYPSNPPWLHKSSRTFGAICWECWECWELGCSLKLPRFASVMLTVVQIYQCIAMAVIHIFHRNICWNSCEIYESLSLHELACLNSAPP